MSMARRDQNESNWPDARKIAWDIVLPYKYVPIMNSDITHAKQMEKWIEENVPEEAQRMIVERIEERPKRLKRRRLLLMNFDEVREGLK